ncbi:MAG: DUF4292 domain-containing protein [Bacteroidales bacterium]|nr:DUF4292 domain-containing protein [Bacteroidales bacterium]
MKLRNIAFLFVFLLLFSACKGKKKKHDNGGNDKPKTEVITTEVDTKSPLFKEAENMYLKQDTFSTAEIKFDLKLQLPDRNVSGSGTLRIANDSLIWLYIKAFGLEIARAKLTKDSVFAVVKLKNQYFKSDYTALKQFFPIDFDFSILQSVFLNKFFLFPKNKIENLAYFSPQEKDGKLQLNSVKSYNTKYGMSDEIIVARETSRVLKNSAVVLSSQKGVSINYKGENKFPMHTLPEEVQFEGIGTDFTVTFFYNKAVFGKALQYPLTIPANYTEMKF